MLKHELPILDGILYGTQQPWNQESILLDEFKDRLDALQACTPTHTAKYEIKYQDPFNPKARYYFKLIEIELAKSLDKLTDLLAPHALFEYRKYWYTEIMNMLQTRLKDIGQVINSHEYSLSFIDPQKTTFNQDQEHKANTYIIHFLKLAYMQLLLEIQDSFPDLQDETYTEDGLYMEFTLEPVPTSSFIHLIPVIPIKEVQKPKKKKSAKHLHSFKYKKYPNDEGALTNLRNSLIKSQFIDSGTSLTQIRKLFSGEEIEEAVKWTGIPSELSYFVKQLHKQYINDLGQNLWTVAIKCFVDENGNPYERTIRKLDDLKQSSKDALDKCLGNL